MRASALVLFSVMTSWTLFTACGDKGGDSGQPGDGGGTDGGMTDGGSTDGGTTDGGATTGEAVVVVTGSVYLQTGATVELTVTTINGTDSAYTWESSDDGVATVSDGLVTGVAPG